MADETKSASTAAKSARATSAKSTTAKTTPAPGDPASTSSDTGASAGASSSGSDDTAAGTTSTRTDTTSLADAGAASVSRELGSGQRLAGGSEHDYPAVNSPRLSDPEEQGGGERVEQFGAVGTLSPTRLDERNRQGDVEDAVKVAQFPTPRFNQGPPSVVVASQVPPPFADQYTKITEDLFEAVYREGATTPSSRLVAPAGSYVRSDFLEQMSHASSDPTSAAAVSGTNPGDQDKAEHRREVAEQ